MTTGDFNRDGRLDLAVTNSSSGNVSILLNSCELAVPPTIAKTFNPATINAGATTQLTLSFTNPASNPALIALAVTDNLPAGVTVAATPGLTNTYGGTVTGATAGSTSFALSGGMLAGGASCQVQVNVTSSTPGMATNTTGNVMASANGVPLTGNQAMATLTVNCPTITAQVSGGGAIRPGQSAIVTVTLSGGTAPYTVTLTNGGGTLTGASPLNFSVSPATTTTYQVQTATDTNGCPATASGAATVIVDDTPPTITCPANQVGVTSGTAATVTYPPPTVQDNNAGASFACLPASGTSFMLGTTTVNCTATDAAGNTATCSFTVTVRQPRPAIKDLIARVRALVPGTLTTAQANQLLGHLELANTRLERGQKTQACTHLQNFVNQVSAFVSGGQLTQAQGQAFINYANKIRNAVGCAGSPFPI